jgi:hypothetical protein
MRVVAGVAVLLALASVGAAPARKPPPPGPLQKAALAQIEKAAAAGRIESTTAADGRAAVQTAAALVRRLPPPRRGPLADGIAQVAALGAKLTEPRAVAVFGQLRVTSDYLALHKPPAPETDLTDADGVVHRWFSGQGFVFHPLANFGALNAAVASGDGDRVQRLADALLARGVPQPGGGLAWEYYFDFAGGRAPWTSGMAQAVAAQSFAGAAGLGSGDSTALLGTAQAAYRAIPGRLVRQIAGGPWIKLYSFNRLVVLNAQLQAVVSLRAYAEATGDSAAAALVTRLQTAAANRLASFDTGYWTYYSLPRNPSPLDYQQYVVQLLRRLAAADERFGEAARRFADYERQPPVFRLADAGPGAVRFWLSKPASVRLTAIGPAKRLWLESGWHSVHWKLPKLPGIYPVKLSASDSSGNRTAVEALPIVRVAPSKPEPNAPLAAPPRSSTSAASTTPATRPGFVVGAGLDDPAHATLAEQLKLGAVRLTVAWPLGATTPDAVTVASLRRIPASTRLIVELAAEPTPTDDVTRGLLATYAASLVRQVPGLKDLVLGPAPVTGTAAAYAATLASVYDAVKSVRSTVAVAGLLDGAAAPKATLTAIAGALEATARTTPILDELAFRPATAGSTTAWTLADQSRLAAALTSTFAGTGQPGTALPVLIDGLAVGTTIPAAKAGAYLGGSDPSSGVSETEQAAAYAQAIEASGCRTNVVGVILNRLVDGPEPGEQSGLYYADGTAKASAPTAAKTFQAAARGELSVCPGLGVSAAARKLVFPPALTRSSPPSVELGCERDCLFLVTLDRADGKPVLARRGALRGGAAPKTVRLPKLPLAVGSYTLSVRLVAQANPGPVELLTSPALALR